MSPIVPLTIKELYKAYRGDDKTQLTGIPPDDIHEILYRTKRQMGEANYYASQTKNFDYS